jgi:hypothetical protein
MTMWRTRSRFSLFFRPEAPLFFVCVRVRAVKYFFGELFSRLYLSLSFSRNWEKKIVNEE